jgi:hypothetical protein
MRVKRLRELRHLLDATLAKSSWRTIQARAGRRRPVMWGGFDKTRPSRSLSLHGQMRDIVLGLCHCAPRHAHRRANS